MAVATHLADKSALARLDREPVARRLGPMIEAGLVGTCGVIELEVRFSARSHREYEAIGRDRALGYEWFPMNDDVWGRALEVQHALSEAGQLRAVKFPDLLIAATAERHGLVVIHYDHDYDTIATVTNQPTEWVVAPGSVP
ncbi:MAG: PIN domain nuclease [Acidimicrobiales bacterium]